MSFLRSLLFLSHYITSTLPQISTPKPKTLSLTHSPKLPPFAFFLNLSYGQGSFSQRLPRPTYSTDFPCCGAIPVVLLQGFDSWVYSYFAVSICHGADCDWLQEPCWWRLWWSWPSWDCLGLWWHDFHSCLLHCWYFMYVDFHFSLSFLLIFLLLLRFAFIAFKVIHYNLVCIKLQVIKVVFG